MVEWTVWPKTLIYINADVDMLVMVTRIAVVMVMSMTR